MAGAWSHWDQDLGGNQKGKCHATHSDGDNWNSLFEHLGSQKPLEVASSSFDFCQSWPMVHRYFEIV